jgi:hypothetical protein
LGEMSALRSFELGWVVDIPFFGGRHGLCGPPELVVVPRHGANGENGGGGEQRVVLPRCGGFGRGLGRGIALSAPFSQPSNPPLPLPGLH